MKVLVLGNCQAAFIGKFIKRAAPGIEVIEVPAIHTINRSFPEPIYDNTVKADYILCQPIDEKFGLLSVSSMKSVSDRPAWVSYPSIYFSGHLPHLKAMKSNAARIDGPLSIYHDLRIVKAYVSGLSERECVEALAMPDHDFCSLHYRSQVAEARRREENLDIKVVDYFLSIEKEERIFHTFNHPSNKILWKVAIDFLRLVDVEVDSGAAPWRRHMGDLSAAIVPEMAEIAGIPYASNQYVISNRVIPTDELVRGAYEVYRKQPQMAQIARENGVALA